VRDDPRSYITSLHLTMLAYAGLATFNGSDAVSGQRALPCRRLATHSRRRRRWRRRASGSSRLRGASVVTCGKRRSTLGTWLHANGSTIRDRSQVSRARAGWRIRWTSTVPMLTFAGGTRLWLLVEHSAWYW